MSVFSNIEAVRYEGPDTDNDFAFRVYDKDRVLLAKRMEDWLRLSVCYWHSFNWSGTDVFGQGTLCRPWLGPVISQEMAEERLEAAFDFLAALGVRYFTFHDLDVIATAQSLPEHIANLQRIEPLLSERMVANNTRLLWGTANLFSHPRYAAGAATSPYPDVFACAAAQVRFCLDATHRLGGENYVLWGGREGYDTLLNTNIKRELDQYGRFLSMVVDHKYKIGFKGQILVEPKPFEPTKHQYDRDVAAVYAFLQKYRLEQEVRVNIEVNHATLAGLDFEHEVAAAQAYGIFGSVDINRGDPRNGWDTDQFPNNAQDLVPAMLRIVQSGGFSAGGFNFDAKLRRASTDPHDLFLAHICGIDTLARALLSAADLLENKRLMTLMQDRYSGWDGELGRNIEAGVFNLTSLSDLAVKEELDPRVHSGKQELLESLVAARVHR